MNGYAYPIGEKSEDESPFLDSAVRRETPAEPLPSSEAIAEEATPFVSGEVFPAVGTPQADGLHELLGELYETEFDQTLRELSDRAAAAVAESPFTQGETGSPQAEEYVREWLAPVHAQAEEMLEAIHGSLGSRDLAAMSEHEVDELLAEHEPLPTGANPVFEGFLGGLWKKIKGAVHGAVDLAKKGVSALGKLIPIGAILGRLKQLVKPLLERVLQMALDRLPAGLRPAAELLKQRLFGSGPVPPPPAPGGAEPTTGEVSEVQREFDLHTAGLLLAPGEAERDAVVAEAEAATALQSDDLPNLHAARERLAGELATLGPGEDPQPAVENFLPAVMAVLPLIRLGVSLIGRDRIVHFIARYVSDLIKPYIGDLAPNLSQAIASAGLGMLSLEAPVDPKVAAATVLAGTVEDTVRHVGEQASEALEHPELLEAAVAGAFERAAAAHFPPALLKPEHRPVHLGRHHDHASHPEPWGRDHRVGAGHEHHHPGSGMWARLPRRHTYRRYTKPLTAHVTPTIARQIKVFGGATLEAFLRDRYGITGELSVPAHIYEALPGATLGRIAAAERRTPGLGHARAAWKLQPLTPEIAGLLFGEPGLGRAIAGDYLAGAHRIAVGQRFYYLELRGSPSRRAPEHAPASAASPSAANPPAPAAPAPAPSASAAPVPAAPAAESEVAPGRSTQVNVRVEPHRRRLRIALYLSESDAQEAAGLIRSHGPSAAAKLLHERLHHGLHLALSGDPRGHLHWIEAAATPGDLVHPHPAHPAILAVAEHATEISRRVFGWAARAIVSHVSHDAASFLAAADRRGDGVTLVVSLHGVRLTVPPAPGMVAPSAVVRVMTGFHHA